MNAQEIEFTNKCPAWARKLGVKTLNVWQIIEYIMPYDKSERYDYLDWEVEERHLLTADEAVLAQKVLQAWDEMAPVHHDH